MSRWFDREAEMGKSRKRAPGTRLREAIVLIPLAYNDGTKIAHDILKSIYAEAYAKFSGWTLEGKVTGAYRMQTGQRVVEKLQKLSIILPESQLRELEQMVARWAALLLQEVILPKVTDARVNFVRPNLEDESS